MNEMVRRVADAIGEAGGVVITWSQARAAIAAMREPTDEMIVAAYKDPSFVPDLSPTGTWQAMIDAALIGSSPEPAGDA